jgi:hypothetical protein
MNNDKYNIDAKETIYNGVKFRSRLEAHWACMFDWLHWEWVYEPYAIGNYNPDFVLKGKPYDILVEVKPAFLIDDKLRDRIKKAIISHPLSALILDENPLCKTKLISQEVKFGEGLVYFGLDDNNNRDHSYWDEIVLKDNGDGWQFDISSFMNYWNGMIFNDEEQRKNFVLYNGGLHEYIKNEWVERGNMVRFEYK